MEESRLHVFRALKGPCVGLSQVALRHKAKKTTGQEVIQSLESLHKTLETVSAQANALDPKLADYAFFPLSHIFRDRQDLPLRAVEVALQCLLILITYGWRGQLASDLGKQLLLLLSFLAGGSPTEAKVKSVNEELGSVAFECLASLFKASSGSIFGAKSVEPQDVPILGHTVTVVLDGIADGPSIGVRLAALAALDNIISCISDIEALKGIFPGVVSSVTKVLSLKNGSKPSYKVLTASLAVLTTSICKVMSDSWVNGSKDAPGVKVESAKSIPDGTAAWAIATAGQIKMALANIIPLRSHERIEVRTALLHLCKSIIINCRESLSQSIPILTETLVVVCSFPADENSPNMFKLDSFFAANDGLIEILKASLHDWVVALPRIMSSNDDSRKRRTIEQISTAFKLLEHQDARLDVLFDSVALNLRASVSAAIQASSKIRPALESSLEVSQLIESAKSEFISAQFNHVLSIESSSRTTMLGLQHLVVQLKDHQMSTGLQQGISSTLRTTSGDEQLAGLWLCLQLLNDASSTSVEEDQYLNLPPCLDSETVFLDDVYSFSLDVLSRSAFEDEDRWKLQALSLEAVALQARHQKSGFRPELVDALYPILERLGSNNAVLQQHAITCLNIVSQACEYPNSASLIIDNADYLVNAVALKLNTFDVSPQASQVLVMMVRLCGPSLIPYLDDLVESIFSILACYHGYPKLVESLFSVLDAIVQETSKTSKPAIKPSTDTTTRPQPYQTTTISELASILRSSRERAPRPPSPPPSPPSSKSPTSPILDAEESEPLPPSKTHTILTNITALTPSHLTTPSPPLRSHILNLLTSALPVLATDTDTFLPQAATLWPAVVARLYDGEAYTVLAAANALATLCECAGDFLYTRVQDQWERLCELYWRVEADMREEARVQKKGMGKAAVRGMKWRVWDAMVGLVVVMCRDVGAGEEMEDRVFEVLGGLVHEREDVRMVLGTLNADALWLVEERARVAGGGERLMKPDNLEGWEFRDVDMQG